MSSAPDRVPDRRGCRRARARMRRRFEGVLPLEELFLLEEHVAACTECAAEDGRDRALLEALGELPAPALSTAEVERHVAAVRAALDREPLTSSAAAPRGAPRALPRLATRLLAAAGLAGVVGLVLWRSAPRSGSPPSPSARHAPEAPAAQRVVAAPAAPAASSASDAPAGPAAAAPAPVPFDLEAVGASEVDRAALAARRAEVRVALDAAAAPLAERLAADVPPPAEAVEALCTELDRRLAALDARGWPTARLVAGFVDDADAVRARAALRWLGARGGADARPELGRALGRPALARAAVQALADLGDDGVAGLARALWEPALGADVAARVIAWLEADAPRAAAGEAGGEAAAERAGPHRVREWLGAAVARAPRHADAGTARCAAELARVAERLGAARQDLAAAALLLQLAERCADLEEPVLDALRRTPGASAALTAAVAAGRGDERFLLRAVDALHPEGCLPWVVERARSRTHRARALRVLATFDGVEAPAALLALDPGARLAPELVAAWRAAIDHDAERLVVLAHRCAADGARRRHLLEALVLSERPGAASALLALGRSADVPASERSEAVRAAGELGRGLRPDRRDRLAAALAASFADLTAGAERLAADHVLAAHALDGREAVRALLASLPERRAERVLDLLPSDGAPGASTATRLRLVRALGPLLPLSDDPRNQP